MNYGSRGAYEPFYMLWVDGEALAENIVKNIVQWSYDDNEDKLDELRFTLLDPDLVLQESEQLKQGAQVLCLWGYIGGVQESRTCNIEEVEYNLPENGMPQIVVKALDAGAALIKRKARTCMTGVTGAEALAQIAKKHDLKTRINMPEDFKMEFVAQGGKSDYEFIREIAMERGCNTWIENDVLIAQPYALSESSKTFTYKKDIISLRAKHNGAQGQGERENVQVAGMNPVVNEPINESSPEPPDEQEGGSGGGSSDSAEYTVDLKGD